MKSLLLFALATTAVNAQSCMPITSSTVCGPFSAFGVSSSHAADLAAFDVLAKNQGTSTADYVSFFKRTYNCPGFEGRGQSFGSGMFCGLAVDTAWAKKTCTQADPIMLCPDSVQRAVDTLQAIFTNKDFCDQQNVPENRTAFITTYNKYLTRAKESKNPKCVVGLQSEVARCGYATDQDAQEYCSKVPNDACCKNLGKTGLALTADTPKLEGKGASNNTMIIAIAVGAVLGVLLIIFLVLMYRRRKAASASSSERGMGMGMGMGMDRPMSGMPMGEVGNFQEPLEVAETYQVIYNYVPNLSDEIYLYVGDKVILKTKFDDGWAVGYNMTTKQEGSFPLACVDIFQGDDVPNEKTFSVISQRMSSLYGKYQN
jgi:hypothetical protein